MNNLTAPTPDADRLFQVSPKDGQKLLPKDQSQAFHRSTSQLLFISMRARPNLLICMSFLTKRGISSDEDDWGKLKRIPQCLRGTRYMQLNISVDSLTTICWYVDASYGIHPDCKDHTDMMMTLDVGAAMSMSQGHKINVKSLMELELVGIDDALPDI